MPTRQYLDETIVPILLQALSGIFLDRGFPWIVPGIIS